jgi:hypothetical protein
LLGLRRLMERTLQCYREDGRVERILKTTLRDIEFGHFAAILQLRPMPELLTQIGAKEGPWGLGTPHLT